MAVVLCEVLYCRMGSGDEHLISGSVYSIYRVSQEERSIFWEVIVSLILSKNVHMNMCTIPNGFRDRDI